MIDLSELRHALADAQRRLDDLSDALANRPDAVPHVADAFVPIACEAADLIDEALPTIKKLARPAPKRRRA